jgi:hypothetical protein
LAVAVVLALSGCQVHTQISVDAGAGGRGVVRVSVSLDRAALAAIGGSRALAAQLQTADLTGAGWTVTGPAPGPGSTTVVAASHPYDTPAQAGSLVGELAGSGPAGARPFRLALTQRHGFWRTETILTGTVDLRCGVACFGDSGLTKALGFPTGVNPGPLGTAAGQRPDQVFTFGLDATLRGSVVSSNAAARTGATLQWEPRLGQTLQLAGLTRTWNSGRIMLVSVAGGIVVVGGLGALAYWWWRRRRRRAGPRGGLHRKPRGRVPEAVTPHT